MVNKVLCVKVPTMQRDRNPEMRLPPQSDHVALVFVYRQPPEAPARAEPCVNCDELELSADKMIARLNEQLHEKDMKLTDVRLEALSSAHQLEQLREMLSRMKVCGGGYMFSGRPSVPLSVRP